MHVNGEQPNTSSFSLCTTSSTTGPSIMIIIDAFRVASVLHLLVLHAWRSRCQRSWGRWSRDGRQFDFRSSLSQRLGASGPPPGIRRSGRDVGGRAPVRHRPAYGHRLGGHCHCQPPRRRGIGQGKQCPTAGPAVGGRGSGRRRLHAARRVLSLRGGKGWWKPSLLLPAGSRVRTAPYLSRATLLSLRVAPRFGLHAPPSARRSVEPEKR